MNTPQENLDLFYKKIKHSCNDKKVLQKKILNHFPKARNFSDLLTVGRLKIHSLVFECDGQFYAIPLKTPQELMKLNKTTGKRPIGIQIINNANVPLMPYVSARYSRNIIDNCDCLLEYEKAYTLEYMISQIYSVYSEIGEFKEFTHIIIEAFECFVLEKYASAISLLISSIEGISRKYCKNNSIYFNEGGSLSAFKCLLKARTREYLDNILLMDFSNNKKYLIPSEFKYYKKKYRDKDNNLKTNTVLNSLLLYYDGGLNLIESFYRFGIEYLYKSDSEYELNRHTIFHGINKEYCTKINFYRIFSCLECLSFAITLEALGNFNGIKSELLSEYSRTMMSLDYWKFSLTGWKSIN